MIVTASTSETSTAIVSVMDSAAKNCPTTPCSSPSGRNTTTVVMVDVVTGTISSCTASRMARARSGVKPRWRTMFSVITTASSITRPMAIAIAPSVIRLNVCPTSDMTNTVMASVSGIDAALMAVMRQLAQEEKRMITASDGADQHRVAHRRHGVAHERRLVVHRLEDASRRQRALESSTRPCATLSAIATRVAAHLARDVEQRRRLSVAGDDAHVVLGARFHRRHVAHAQPVPDHHVADVVGVVASCAVTTRYCL